MKILRRVAGLAALSLVLSGCASSPSFLDPASLISDHQAALYRDILVESGLIFVVVIAALVWSLIRDRDRAGSKGLAPQVYGKLSWVAIPVLMIVLLDGADFAWMTQTMRAIAAPAPAAQDINVHVIGHRWWWEFDYTDLGIKTANELHLPVGATVQITLDSVDVIHSFWVPQLTGKTDAIPGQTNHMWLTADSPGLFTGQCTEFCGVEHAMMRIHAVVDTQAGFSAWVANQQKAAREPLTVSQRFGHQIVTSVCATCHSLDPAEPQPKVGPNLAHLFSRSTFAGATYDLNEENLRSWLQDTQAMKPGNGMDLKLSSYQIHDLLAYLTTLK
jgi:cytochrome c oxidase subunit 2